MAGNELHDEMIVFDGLIVSNWERSVFEDMRAGGLTGANCTCCVWENFAGTMANIARWKSWIDENDDLLLQASHDRGHPARQARASGRRSCWGSRTSPPSRTSSATSGSSRSCGVGIVQMAYNTQNLIGSGCYESEDGGLSDFGREVGRRDEPGRHHVRPVARRSEDRRKT